MEPYVNTGLLLKIIFEILNMIQLENGSKI